MGLDRPELDGCCLGSRGERFVIGHGLELTIEIDRPVPPLVERHLALSYAQKPIGWLTLDRQGETPGCEQLLALKPKPRTVHCVFGVESVLADELLSATSPTAPVTAGAKSEKALALGLHITEIARDDVS